MEFDSQSLCSDEGVELTISENEEIYPGDYPYLEENQPSFLEAKTVYILMPKNVPISRATRLQWLIDHLNVVINVPSLQKFTESTELEIISAVPREQTVVKCNRYLITTETEVKFIAHSYRFVYCLDMSPSQSNVDVQRGEVIFDEILDCFKSSLSAIIKQFTVPGNSLVFQPCIYLTVMVNTPFFMSPAQQVLVKGVKMSNNNLNYIISYVEKQFHLLEGKIADVSVVAHEQLESQRALNEGIVGQLFDLPDSEKFISKIPMVTADANFVNMLRYSMLAISLLPDLSISHILVITDGIVAMPDSNIMESLLYQLHYDSISVSFLKVGSGFHPHSSAGYVPYVDLLYFLAHSTLGSCFQTFPEMKSEPSKSLNIYQKAFLLWSFHSINKYVYPKNICPQKWTTPNDSFYNHKPPNLLSKKQVEDKVNASILLMLARRLREGFTVDNIYFLNGDLEIKMSLQWKSFIYINYKISSEWPPVKNYIKFEINISAPYEFLHDITCMIKKDTKSVNRQATIKRFWLRLTQLSSEDLNSSQNLSSFQISNKDWYTLPESVKNGIPVFTINNIPCTEATKLILSLKDNSCTKFVHVWQTLAVMETNIWRKWLHTHKISLILKHDNPLPRHLHVPNSSQRYQIVQCRQATAALYNMLSVWSSFTLIDNNTYVKLLCLEPDKPPTGFCLIRVTSKFPCAVLHVGFKTGTPGELRQTVCDELKTELSGLSYLTPPQLKAKDNTCCVLLQKPIEKILIRYERIPSSFTTVVFPDGTQPPNPSLTLPSPVSGSLFTTLSRYLYHKRWIWSAFHPSNPKSESAISRILITLTGMRIKEGFSFAHSSSGIITMVLELWMDQTSSCVVQYVLFPPHCAWCSEDFYSASEDENDMSPDNETEMQLVTEVWIEPQYGHVVPSNPRISYMDNKAYYEIADVICRIDLQCISSLLTMEHLSLMCQDKTINLSFNRMNSSTSRKGGKSSRNSHLDLPHVPVNGSQCYPIITPRIEHIPFKFDPINILPLCQQTELLFSMFIEGKEVSLGLLGYDQNKANDLLLSNILDNLNTLHDQELELSKQDSDQFTQQILLRQQNKTSEYFNKSKINECDSKIKNCRWRCFIKGISVTHVILTFIPFTLDDVKALMAIDSTRIPSLNESIESNERSSSRASNYSDVPINIHNCLCLPIYVFDCPLAMLVKAYINNADDSLSTIDDIYEDHRFKATDFIQEENLKLKAEDCYENIDRNEDAELSESRTVRQHSKALVLAHSRCFTISLFMALHKDIYVHNYDVQSAMDQCEEDLRDIDITDYIMTTCGHIKHHKEDKISIKNLHQATPCNELSSLHSLIKDKFGKIVNVAFYQIPTNEEFYYYHLINKKPDETGIDSDDEVSLTLSDMIEFKTDRDNYGFYADTLNSKLDENEGNELVNPLFLHLICTLRYNNDYVSQIPVRLLPTCLGELIQNIDPSLEYFDKSSVKVSLDIMCLTLPTDAQNMITNYSKQGLRSTSFCSDSFQPSIDDSSLSETSDALEYPVQLNLPEAQKKTVLTLREEIKWLLKDEIATALLDIEPVTSETLNFVTNHVMQGSSSRSSCVMEIINLNFVFASAESNKKFVEEFSKIKLPLYKLCKEDDFYYLAKDPSLTTRDHQESVSFEPNYKVGSNSLFLNDFPMNISDYTSNSHDEYQNEYDPDKSRDEVASQISDISNNESLLGTEGGYDEDDESEDYEDDTWLESLNKKRNHLPNFWLIMKIEQDIVTIYFHCRFLEMKTLHVRVYLEVQRAVSDAIRDLCKKVNQLLLLQHLYETKTCDPLLEPDDNHNENGTSPISRNTSYVRLKSMEEGGDESEFMPCSASMSEASQNFKHGFFSCPVVWEKGFVLHPRLKIGPGKSGISRGILALKHILEKFSVSNRNNMFVYRDNQQNVFYLRLHENMPYFIKTTTRPNEYENAPVSRSPSMASLPLSQNKSILTQSEQSITSIGSLELRPRLRSFGEKESKEVPNEDTLILKVHGITEAGDDVQLELVQVLQNRLDDAVLEFLSIMLARNAMCPLTPEDVQFIQKPFKPPEVIIRFSIQDYIIQYLNSFMHYLKQNLLQFLNIPKYTDSRSHFKDYSENSDVNNKLLDDTIFIYNQSQNPSSGNRGIACIALAVISKAEKTVVIDIEKKFESNFKQKVFEPIVESHILESKDNLPHSYLEFRLWKQGRVNIDNLSLKLKAGVSQAMWDILTEYYLLKKPLCVPSHERKYARRSPVEIETAGFDFSNEIEFNCVLESHKERITYKRDSNKTDKCIIDGLLSHRNRYNRIAITSKSKTSRFLTYDTVDGNAKEPESILNKEPVDKTTTDFNSYETGDDGVLSEIYADYLPSWFEFGSFLNVPAVRKMQINLNNRHLPNVTIRELVNMLQDSPKAFCAVPLDNLNKDEIYTPFLLNNYVQKYVIISRNFLQWGACLSTEECCTFPDVLRPQALKHSQKFIPGICNNTLIPRQKILWIVVESDSIVIYTYNWAKDNIDKMSNNCNNLGLWLCVRSCFINSVISQKLGLFHNQSLTRKCYMIANNMPYLAYIGDFDYMTNYPKDQHKKRVQSSYNLHSILEAFRDSFRISKEVSNDPVVMLTNEMHKMKSIEKKQREEMKKLHNMYQSRTSSTTVSLIFLLMQNSRIVHYCHTPLLFLARWRLKSAATRDHSLYPSQAIQIVEKISNEEKESWHTDLCYSFFTDYRQYLQTLGFMPLQIDSTRNTGLWTKDKSSYNSIFFIQKTILGGILLFTVEFCEPFFITKLHAIECNRLQNISSRASINRFTLSFLDECDRVKILMHLHSFTYDYHLRCIYNYISITQSPTKLCDKYNVHQFLDDFMKYYNKTPNFARNLVHADTLTIKNLVTEGRQLYDYLLSNVAQYDFKVYEMETNEEIEYILVQVTSTPQVSYKDSQDRQHTDDFDITLVVYNLCTPYSPNDNVLHLKYYLILTSKREIYPKSEVEQKLGKFRTVSSTARSLSALERNCRELEESTSKTIESETNDATSEEDQQFTSENESSDNGNVESVTSHQSGIPHVEIYQESVNYLGYYSSHEQLMHQLIMDKANTTQKHIKDMVAKGMVHCRTYLLWNRLISLHDSNSLSYEEFMELKSLAKLDHLCDLHPNLGPLLNQPLGWYQGLVKLLLIKYTDQHRKFISPDGNIQHYVILHPNYFGAFMLLSIDLHTSRGELYAVYREPHKQEDEELCLAYQKSLLDGFVNCISYYLWTGMISN